MYFCKNITSRLVEGQLIVRGDLNVPLVPKEGTSTGSSSVPSSLRKQILQLLYGTKLVDVWHLFHPGERDYSFFSLVYKSYSCIDFFVIPPSQLHSAIDTTIGPITCSDHAPIFMKYNIFNSSHSKSDNVDT